MTEPTRAWSRKNRCLRAFAKTGSVAAAARAAGVHRSTVYDWKADRDFAARWSGARERALDALHDALVDRALLGSARPVPRNGPTTGLRRLQKAIAARQWRALRAAAHLRS